MLDPKHSHSPVPSELLPSFASLVLTIYSASHAISFRHSYWPQFRPSGRSLILGFFFVQISEFVSHSCALFDDLSLFFTVQKKFQSLFSYSFAGSPSLSFVKTIIGFVYFVFLKPFCLSLFLSLYIQVQNRERQIFPTGTNSVENFFSSLSARERDFLSFCREKARTVYIWQKILDVLSLSPSFF